MALRSYFPFLSYSSNVEVGVETKVGGEENVVGDVTVVTLVRQALVYPDNSQCSIRRAGISIEIRLFRQGSSGIRIYVGSYL